MKHKLMALFLSLVLTLSLSACGGNSGNSGANNTTPPPSTLGTTDNGAPAATSNGSNTADNASDADNSNAKLTPSVTPADGFVKNEKDTANLTYNKNDLDTGEMLSLAVTTYTLGGTYKTVDEYLAGVQKEFKDNSSDVQFSAITDVKVNGMDAKECTYTGTMSTVAQKGRYDFIEKDGTVYTILCLGMNILSGDADGTYDASADDFQSMIDSFTLK